MCCQLLGLGGGFGFVMVSVRDGLDGVVNGRTVWGVTGGCNRTAVTSGTTPQTTHFTFGSMSTKIYVSYR
jgi:hypothetical protein